MNKLIISAVGFDRPGILSEISGVITSHGGNVEESRMSRMGSDFTITMLVSVSPDWRESLEVSLQSINNLAITTKQTEIQDSINSQKCQIDLSGADNEGIVKVLSKYLAEKSINIIEMDTHITHAPISGTPLFNLKSLTTVPENINLTEIQSELNRIAQILGVKIVVHQSEPVTESV